eukprot:Skav223709  [mRNA]  locus=scaffold2379:91736:98564:- [translate_table: standard]
MPPDPSRPCKSRPGMGHTQQNPPLRQSFLSHTAGSSPCQSCWRSSHARIARKALLRRDSGSLADKAGIGPKFPPCRSPDRSWSEQQEASAKSDHPSSRDPHLRW